ncbi:ferrous iron transport protein B [Pseudomonas aeruginosa]|nr:ferrous iron transport protein B [Pseudomonas aeruginosa]
MTALTLGLIGNPNSGKTTLFNQLTGSRQRVGNWPASPSSARRARSTPPATRCAWSTCRVPIR